ncbi:hypothetical protein QFZ51_003078 [Chitinophaga sp. W3I9]|uniref:hypothetical protein n=1 Tax=Chitinophaga sp. W3I9 TaxID=3373924 RepID=UPI003D1AF08B
MRKQMITVLLMLIWLCQLSGRYVVMLGFYVNQEYIAKNLCINRDQPQLHCNGKCHLAKQLREEDRKEHESPWSKTDNRSEIFYACLPDNNILKPAFTAVNTNYPVCDHTGAPVDRPSSVFRPPIAPVSHML